MFDAATALALMQYGDSAYPAGGFAFSWGVEGLAADGLLVDRADLDDFIARASHPPMEQHGPAAARKGLSAPGMLDEIAAVDRYAEAATPSAAMRDGSRRAGRALLSVSARLGEPLSSDYRALISERRDALAICPSCRRSSIATPASTSRAPKLVSGWTLVNGLVSAAVRLGVLGHIEAQRSLALARTALARLLAETQPEDIVPSSFTPADRNRGVARPICGRRACSRPKAGPNLMMNLSPTEMDRLVIFTAAEMARRNRRLGIRLSHPEAVAFLTDEVMLAARRDMAYEDIRDMASRLLTTDDVEPGVAEMIPLIYIECAFAEGTKLMALFEPIGPGEKPTSAEAPPGEIVSPEDEIEIFADSPSVTDRRRQHRRSRHSGAQPHPFLRGQPRAQVRSRRRLGDESRPPAGTGVRFEPGVVKSVRLVPIAGARVVRGQAGLVNGPLDREGAREAALSLAKARGYLGV